MIVIIDGYNLVKHALGASLVSHAERDQFVARLVQYLRQKQLAGIIVFDGGSDRYVHVTHHGEVQVVFSGFKEKADTVIMRYIDKHVSRELLVVSSDREIRQYAHARNKQTITSPEFYAHMVRKQEPDGTAHTSTQLYKMATDSPIELDELMSESTKNISSKDDDASSDQRSRCSSAHQVSKKERKQQRVLRKL